MKVFISSVMEGFADERDIARRAVEAMGMTPIMAETFPAQPRSSKTACLAGVRDADCYLGIFADRYGWAPSGEESVTVQEYREAVRTGKAILIIRRGQSKDREKALAEFLAELGDFESGYFFGRYDTVAQLGPEVTKALWHLNGASVSGSPNSSPAEAISERSQQSRNGYSGPTLLVSASPHEHLESVDTRKFGGTEFHRRLSKLARYDASIFDEEHGSKQEEGAEHIEIYQERDGTRVNAIRVDTSRRVLICRDLSESERPNQWFSHLGDSIVDEVRLAEATVASFSLLAALAADPALQPQPRRWWVQAGLAGMDHRMLGRRPSQPIHSLSLGQRVDEVVIVPAKPLIVTTAEAASPSDIASRLVDAFVRKFKEQGAYYDPQRQRR